MNHPGAAPAEPSPRRSVAERNRLVEDNLALAAWAAQRIAPRADGHLFDDLHQAARLGLVRAAEEWDPARGRFSTFASWWMFRYVVAELKGRDLISLPVNLAGEARAELRSRLRPARLQHEGEDFGGSRAVPDPWADDPADLAAAAEEFAARDAAVRDALRFLHRPDREVVELRYIEGRTLEQAGRVLACSKERVRQLEVRALARLAEHCPHLANLLA